MADPRYSFYKALAAFERVEVFANRSVTFACFAALATNKASSVNDRTVPYPTGAIEAHDPFALARAKARKLADERGEDPNSEIDIREGGLEVYAKADLALDPADPLCLVAVPSTPPEDLSSLPTSPLHYPLLLPPPKPSSRNDLSGSHSLCFYAPQPTRSPAPSPS